MKTPIIDKIDTLAEEIAFQSKLWSMAKAKGVEQREFYHKTKLDIHLIRINNLFKKARRMERFYVKNHK